MSLTAEPGDHYFVVRVYHICFYFVSRRCVRNGFNMFHRLWPGVSCPIFWRLNSFSFPLLFWCGRRRVGGSFFFFFSTLRCFQVGGLSPAAPTNSHQQLTTNRAHAHTHTHRETARGPPCRGRREERKQRDIRSSKSRDRLRLTDELGSTGVDRFLLGTFGSTWPYSEPDESNENDP